MSDQYGTELQIRDKGKQKMEITTAEDEDCTAQLEELLGNQLEERQRIEEQYDEVKTNLLEDSKRTIRKQLVELEHMLKKQQHDEANTKLLEDHRRMLAKKLDELEHRLQKQHDEAHTKLRERKRMLAKQMEDLERMVKEQQHNEANAKLLEKPVRMLEKHVEELKGMLGKQLDEANTKLLEEMLEKQLKELQQILEKQHNEANTKKLEQNQRGLEKQNDRISGLQTTAFQLTNYYFVSQAVVFTALAGDSSDIACHDVWFPLVLSLVPASLNLCALGLIRNKYRKALKYRDQSNFTSGGLVKKMQDKKSLHKKARNTNEQMIASDFERKSWDAIFFDACMIVFFIIALVIAFGSYWRLCRRKHS